MSQPRRALTRRTAGSRSSRPAMGWASPPGTPAASCQLGPARAGGVGWGATGGHTQVRGEAAGAADGGGGGTAGRGEQDPRRPRSRPGLQSLPEGVL